MLEVLFSATRRNVLELFFSHPDTGYHLREVVRYTGSGRGAIARELKALSDAGVLTLQRRANLAIYRANRDCPVFTELQQLVAKTSGIAGVLKNALDALDGISFAFIFGSASSGTMDNLSDVDVLIVGGVSFQEVSVAVHRAEKTLGRSVSPVVYTETEFAGKVRENHRFIMSVMNGPLIMLIGDEDALRCLGSGQPG